MRADIIEGHIITEGSRAIGINEKSYFGIRDGDRVELSLIEATYLLSKDRLKIFKDNQPLTITHFKEKLLRKGIYQKYIVYQDLRDRGYIVKTGFKYGAEFRLYRRGTVPGQGHSDYLVKVLPEEAALNVLDLSSYVRVAHGVKKILLLSIVDEEGDITYYNIEWTRP